MTATSAHRFFRSLRPSHGALATLMLLGLTTLLAACGSSHSGRALTTAPMRELTSISVGPLQPVVALGVPRQFSATGLFNDGTRQDISASVTWSTSNTAVATISNVAGMTGLASTVGVGQSSITATQGSIAGSTTLTVSAATIVSIALTAPNPSAALGTVQQITATGTYSDQSTQDVTATAVWSTGNQSVATISNAAGSVGMLTAVGPGVTTVTAVFGGVSGTLSITVTNATLTSISVTRPAASLAKGTSEQFTATGLYSDNSNQNITAAVSWSSSNTAFATVGDAAGTKGLATGVAEGTATIQATLGGISGSNSLAVTAATLVSLAISPPGPQLAAGTQRQLTAQGTYTDGSVQDLTSTVSWSSSATNVANVGNTAGTNGLASAYVVGTATITAMTGTISGSTTLTVTAATLTSIGVTPAITSVAKGTSQQFTATGVFSDNTTQDLTAVVTWTSSDPTVATISNAAGTAGLATTLAVGTISATAAYGGVTSPPASLTVTPATLVSIAISPTPVSIALGTSQQFSALGTYTDASTQDLTGAVTWDTTDHSIATISTGAPTPGLAESVAVGSTSITATLSTVAAPPTPLTVTAATLVSIAITPANPSIAKGLTQAFVATGTYTDQTMQVLTTSVTWTSSDTTVATIGAMTGIASSGAAGVGTTGTTSISASLGSVTSPADTLTVTAATLVSIAVTPTMPTVVAGFTLQFTATGTYTDGSTPDITTAATWNSSIPLIASISNASGSQGLATGVAVGATLIKASVSTIESPQVTLQVTPQQYAYAANFVAGTVSQYSIAHDTGVLTALSPATTDVLPGSKPFSVAIHPSGRYVYVANNGNGSVSQFNVNSSSGALTTMTVATVSSGSEPNGVTVDTTGRFAYVANYADNTISQYAISTADGSLTEILPRVATGTNPASVAIKFVDATHEFAYVANYGSSSVSQYTVDPITGALTPMIAALTVPAGANPNSMVVDPAGLFAYVTNTGVGTISQYTIDATTGALTPMSPAAITVQANPFSMAIDPTGQHAYIAAFNNNDVEQLSINATTGALTLDTTFVTGTGPSSVAIDSTGKYAYVANRTDGTVSQFSINTDGSLVAIGTIGSGLGTASIAVY